MEVKELLEGQKKLLESIGASVETIAIAQKQLEARIKELESRQVNAGISVPGLEDEAHKFSFFRAIKAIVTNDWSGAGFEKEVFQASRKKAMAIGSDTMGYFVPNEILSGYIEMLRAESVVMKMGATTLTGLQGVPVQIPKQTGGATAYWVGENESITESALTAGQLNLTPKKVGALVKLSNELLKYSNPSVEELVRNDLFITIALAIDYAALRGSGSEHQPRGIANTSGINTVVLGSAGAAPTFDALYDMQYKLQEDNAFRGKLGYVFHPAVRRVLVKTKIAQFTGDTGGEYIIQPMVSEQALVSWMGFPYAMTTQIPINLTKGGSSDCTEIYFGNWADLIIGMWGGVELKASQETSTAFESDQTWIRILQEVDVQVRHAESFCLINDARVGTT